MDTHYYYRQHGGVVLQNFFPYRFPLLSPCHSIDPSRLEPKSDSNPDPPSPNPCHEEGTSSPRPSPEEEPGLSSLSQDGAKLVAEFCARDQAIEEDDRNLGLLLRLLRIEDEVGEEEGRNKNGNCQSSSSSSPPGKNAFEEGNRLMGESKRIFGSNRASYVQTL